MFVMCPLVHNYSVITLDNWHHGPKITKQLTVNICLYSNSTNCMDGQSPFLVWINICSG